MSVSKAAVVARPQGWDQKRLKYCVRLINETPEDVSDLPYIGLEHIESWTGRQISSETAEASDSQASCFQSGDVLFGKLRPYLAKVLRARESGTCSGELLVLRPRCATQDFLFYYLLNRDFIDEVNSSTYGAKMPRANWDFIGSLPVLLPRHDDQRAIAARLDSETARIDTLMEKKQRQIELLQEKRAAFISDVVTRGLNTHAPIRTTGLAWLGDVPNHWDIERTKVIFREINDRSTTGEEELLTVSHITGVTPRSEKDVNMFLAESLEDYKKCQPDDLVINTMWAWMGALGVSPCNGIVSPSYNVYRFRDSNSEPRYYDYLFRTPKFAEEIRCQSKGIWTSRLRLYPEEFFEIRVPCPPREEQRAIVAAIQRETGNYDVLQKKIEGSIERLQEYRTALISAAVTGKLNIRDEVAA